MNLDVILAPNLPMSASDLPEPQAYAEFHPFLKGVFSQWHPTSFAIEGEPFSTAEQWMMFAKASLFADSARALAIRATIDPAQQKRLGAEVQGFDQALWDARKLAIVYRGNLEKFKQNAGALRQLLATAPALLVEANPRDWVWGCGLSETDAGIGRPSHWRGENLLGRILTRVRNELS